jgi:hypothetical protein
MKRNDLLTQEQFLARRITQKFARAENRIRFHNRLATKLRHSVQHINKPLHQNLKILNEVMKNITKKKLHRQWLLGKGFNFGVMTHYIEVGEEQRKCIYDFSISNHKEEADYVIITRIKKESND